MARQLVTISRLRAFRACQRYHHFSYEERLDSVLGDSEAIRFGNVGHAGLEAWLLAIQGVDRAELAEAADAILATALGATAKAAEEEDLDAFDKERALSVIHGYHARWLLAPYEVLAVEAQFRARLVNPATGAISRMFDQGGKIDAIVRDLRDVRVWLVEHKFTGEDVSPGSVYWQRLRVDGQVSIYLDGAAALGFPDVAGCLYDVIVRPDLRPLKATPIEQRKYTLGKGCKPCGGKQGVQGAGVFQHSTLGEQPCAACGEHPGWEDPPRIYANQRDADETPEEFGARVLASIAEAPDRFYARGAVVRFDHELEAARLDVWTTTQQIMSARRAARTGAWIPRNVEACSRMYGRQCPFAAVCSGEASIDDESRYRRRESAHPELTTP